MERSRGKGTQLTITGGTPRSGLAAALAAGSGLLLYGATLADPPGQAYLALLHDLNDGQPAAKLRTRAAALFAALATALSAGLPGPGDAWQRYLAHRVLRDDNPFSHAAQRQPFAAVPDGLRRAAEQDLAQLGRLLALNGERLSELLQTAIDADFAFALDDLGPEQPHEPIVARLVAATAEGDWAAILPDLAAHHRGHGVGIFADYRAFRWVHRLSGGHLAPVKHPDPITFDELIGYEDQRQTVRRNTEHFLDGQPANNLLLYGERGTGKSSTVKALLHAYADRGLRLVEVTKTALGDFAETASQLAERPERFIVFIDDLSFDEGEVDYKELKAILEGGVESRPSNVLLYATSNRRHLIQERHSDRNQPGDEIHTQDTVQEKLSLADRFGVTVIFLAPDQDQYLEIVDGLARQRALPIEPAQLRRRALQWASWNNGRSGRTARQFIDDLTAELAADPAQSQTR